MSEYVEFRVHSEERLQQLARVVAELHREKTGPVRRSVEELQAIFDQDVLQRFEWPAPRERAQRRMDLQTRPVVEMPTESAAGSRWDFDSMIWSIMEAEYSLLGCERASNGAARLNFDALAYPYGGVGGLVALVEAFGFVVTGIEDGTGYVPVPNSDRAR
jgi:hypothetical protein